MLVVESLLLFSVKSKGRRSGAQIKGGKYNLSRWSPVVCVYVVQPLNFGWIKKREAIFSLVNINSLPFCGSGREGKQASEQLTGCFGSNDGRCFWSFLLPALVADWVECSHVSSTEQDNGDQREEDRTRRTWKETQWVTGLAGYPWTERNSRGLKALPVIGFLSRFSSSRLFSSLLFPPTVRDSSVNRAKTIRTQPQHMYVSASLQLSTRRSYAYAFQRMQSPFWCSGSQSSREEQWFPVRHSIFDAQNMYKFLHLMSSCNSAAELAFVPGTKS